MRYKLYIVLLIAQFLIFFVRRGLLALDHAPQLPDPDRRHLSIGLTPSSSDQPGRPPEVQRPRSVVWNVRAVTERKFSQSLFLNLVV